MSRKLFAGGINPWTGPSMCSPVLYRWRNPLIIFGARPEWTCHGIPTSTRCATLQPSQRFIHVLPASTSYAVAHHQTCSRGLWTWKTDRFESRCCNSDVVIASDENYAHKQVISLTPPIYDYLLANVREPEVLRQLREETATMRGSQMQVSPDQAQLLAMLVQILGAEKCIEVGVYTGYSSLAVALVLPESGCLVACERDAASLEVARCYYDRAGVSHKVLVKHGLAVDTLNAMIQNGEACSYDFAFVDAEKRMYQEYFELLLQLVRVGGVIVIDNVLWHGKVADPVVKDSKTTCIRNFNRSLLDDKRISFSMVPIGDGMTICRKR